jgi:serpin B
MLERIDSSDVMFLINAIYFKGDWVSPFDESATRPGVFHLADGSTAQANYMYQTKNYQYQKGDGFTAARLPYGRDKVAMYVLLPDESSNIDALAGTLTQQKLDEIFSRFRDHKLAVQFPKFKVEYGTKRLNSALTRMGMGVAFDKANANFNGIAPVTPSSNLFINYVDHKAYVDVNEKGTEAAAATVISIGVTSAPVVTQFKVDRPFLFMIRDDRSGSILFIGVIMNPVA